MNRNTPTLWVWSLPFHTLGKTHRQQRGKTQLRGETAGGGETHTYVEVCGTVKAVLIGHHTSGETEWQGEEERGKQRGVGR